MISSAWIALIRFYEGRNIPCIYVPDNSPKLGIEAKRDTQMKKIMAALVLLAMSQAGMGFTGNELRDICNDDDLISKSNCVSYISGWWAGYSYGWIFQNGLREKQQQRQIPSVICLPDEVTGPQLAEVVMTYLDQHPDERHQQAVGLIWWALLNAFPCKDQ